MALEPKSATRVIGIDPGLNVTGYGIVVCNANEVKLVEAGVIRMPRRHGESLPERLESLFVELRRVLEEFNPQAMCLEEVYSHANYPRTAILMGHARGVICLAARLAGIPVLSFSAKRVKQSVTGNGNASKLQVQRAVQNYFSLHRVPYPPDVADALAVALCYVNGRTLPAWGRKAVGSRQRAVGSKQKAAGSGANRGGIIESEVASNHHPAL